MISVTGGAGFICSNFVLGRLSKDSEGVITLDKPSYAGNLGSLDALRKDERLMLVHGDHNDKALVEKVLAEDKPRAIVHFAAESHVDRSTSDRFGAPTWSWTVAEATVNMTAKNRRNE